MGAVDRATSYRESPERTGTGRFDRSGTGSKRGNQNAKKNKTQKTRVPINEIAELQQAMDLLFGEQ